MPLILHPSPAWPHPQTHSRFTARVRGLPVYASVNMWAHQAELAAEEEVINTCAHLAELVDEEDALALALGRWLHDPCGSRLPPELFHKKSIVLQPQQHMALWVLAAAAAGDMEASTEPASNRPHLR
eukprot:1157441-Pelagomonas_calceolata.AAC.5